MASILSAADAPLTGPGPGPTIREGTPFSAQLTVTNPYDRAIRVGLLDTSCTCTKLDIADKFLLPKASTTLDVAIDTARRSGPSNVKISVFTTDPDLEAIELQAHWVVAPVLTVDALAPGADPAVRPADPAWQDIYMFVANERPDEPHRLRKNVRIEAPAGEIPRDGLEIVGIDYAGGIWQFVPKRLTPGIWTIAATAKAGVDPLPVGDHDETVMVRTNHPDKPSIKLRFVAQIGAKKVLPPLPGIPQAR